MDPDAVLRTRTVRWIRCYDRAILEAEAEAYEAQAALHGIDLRKQRDARPVSRQELEGMGFSVKRTMVKMEVPHGQ